MVSDECAQRMHSSLCNNLWVVQHQQPIYINGKIEHQLLTIEGYSHFNICTLTSNVGSCFYVYGMVYIYIYTYICTFSIIIAIIRACACWALFVVTLTNTVRFIYIYIYIYNRKWTPTVAWLRHVNVYDRRLGTPECLSARGVWLRAEQSGRSPKVVAVFSATNFSSYIM